MSAGKVKLCDECRYDGGWHYPDTGAPYRCPGIEAAAAAKAVVRLVELAHEKQFEAAKLIIADAAETMAEFSANNIRDLAEAAEIDGPVMGAAFKSCASGPKPVIEATGRTVQSTDAATRHRIFVWRSLVFRGQSVAS